MLSYVVDGEGLRSWLVDFADELDRHSVSSGCSRSTIGRTGQQAIRRSVDLPAIARVYKAATAGDLRAERRKT
jgi:hypothetical protein